MPTESRGEIGQIKPSGWQTIKYDVVDGKCLYSVQPQIQTDYSTGKSQLIEANSTSKNSVNVIKTEQYILNENSKKFYRATCSSVEKISIKNAKEYIGTRAELIAEGYSPCGLCKP